MCRARAQTGAVFGRPQLPEGSSVQPGCNWRLCVLEYLCISAGGHVARMETQV